MEEEVYFQGKLDTQMPCYKFNNVMEWDCPLGNHGRISLTREPFYAALHMIAALAI